MSYRLMIITLLSTMCCVLSISPVRAQVFPVKTVVIVLPYPVGGSTDLLARALAIELTRVWGQSVIVQNISGAGSIIGAEKVANAPPDGHTLLLTIDLTVVSNRFLYKKLPYDPDKSLVPITMIARSGLFVIANPLFAANNMRELVEAARRAPGRVAYASSGIGSHPNLLFETIGKREGVQFLHVPYKGIAPMTNAAMSGEVQIATGSPAAVGSLVRAGKVKALAIGGLHRSDLFPNVPTIAESGYPYADFVIWFGLFAPGGTSARLVERISRDVTSVAKRPDFTEKYITAFGLDLVADTPAEFAAAIRADVKITAEMVKAAGVQPE